MDEETMDKYMVGWMGIGNLEDMDKLLEDYIRDSDDAGEGVSLGTPMGTPGFTVTGNSIASVALTSHYFALYRRENPDVSFKDAIIEFIEKYGKRHKGLLTGLAFVSGDITEEECKELSDYCERNLRDQEGVDNG
jgi:hypothetical protein